MNISHRTVIQTILCLLGLLASGAFAGETFPSKGVIKKQAWFWEQVFNRYSSQTVVIHEMDNPYFIMDIIDFTWLAKKYNKGHPYSFKKREQILNRYIARYDLAIDRFKREGKKALRHGPMENRIYQVYGRQPQQWTQFLKRTIVLRGQTGLADEFRLASKRAMDYLPTMEKIFQKHNIPRELTRIAFVESMFNLNAHSKVGASGIWQFMPQTGKQYLIINHYIDERNSPLKATMAAAKLLSYNYKILKSWPLAVTAYNHGAGGMMRAIKKTGSDDLESIVRNYRSPSFGFASRNFYTEFLAARDVYQSHYTDSIHASSPQLTEVLTSRMSLKEIVRTTPLNQEIIERYNACLKPSAFKRFGDQPLPKNFSLLVPRSLAKQIKYLPQSKQGLAWVE